jgi:hypothetical protein
LKEMKLDSTGTMISQDFISVFWVELLLLAKTKILYLLLGYVWLLFRIWDACLFYCSQLLLLLFCYNQSSLVRKISFAWFDFNQPIHYSQFWRLTYSHRRASKAHQAIDDIRLI